MPQDTTAIVDAWFNQKISTGVIARNTEAFNQVFSALPALKAALDGEPATAPASAPVAQVEQDEDHDQH